MKAAYAHGNQLAWRLTGFAIACVSAVAMVAVIAFSLPGAQ